MGKRGRREPGLGHQQAPGCVLVEPVHQARPLAGAVAQHIEHAVDVAHGAGAALHREPHRLVQDQHVVVLVQHDRPQEFAGFLLGFGEIGGLWSVELERRNPHRGAFLQPVLGVDPLAVDAQLAFADQPLDMGE